MLIIGDKLISDELIQEAFVCNLQACKGACCWEGDFGAPLEQEEVAVLEDIYERVKPFLTPEGLAVIKREGTAVYSDEAGGFVTPLVNNRACAYLTYDVLGIAKCGLELAWREGATDFRKPISCHLYPIRVKKNPAMDFEALNYDRWDICSAACKLGKQLKVPVYEFAREALIRKYGENFYEELEAAAQKLRIE
jgi:hypothetical protein